MGSMVVVHMTERRSCGLIVPCISSNVYRLPPYQTADLAFPRMAAHQEIFSKTSGVNKYVATY